MTFSAEAGVWAQMLTEMARMSLDDRLVMQLHPGSYRNHNPLVFSKLGRDRGADIPHHTEYVAAQNQVAINDNLEVFHIVCQKR